MSPAPDRIRASVSTACWSALLLLLAGRFSLYFYEHLLEFDFEFAARSSIISLTYLTLALLGLILFALRCRTRRQSLWLAMSVLLGVQLAYAGFGWARLALLASLITLALVGVEGVRQNRPLVRDLRQRRIAMLPLLLRSAALWTPLALVALAGLYANGKLARQMDRAIYAGTPIDRFCEMSTASAVLQLPCTLTGSGARPVAMAEVPFDDNLARHVETLFLQRSRALISRAEQEQLAARDLLADLDPATVLGLTREPDPADALIRADRPAARLRRELDRARASVKAVRPPPIAQGFPGPLIGQVTAALLKKERQRRARVVQGLERKLAARLQSLRSKSLKEAQATEAGRAGLLQQKLIRLIERRYRFSSPPSRTEPRAEQLAYLIRELDRGETASLRAIRDLSKSSPEIARAALHMPPACTVQIETGEDDAGADGRAEAAEYFPCPSTTAPESDATQLTAVGLKRSADLSIDRWQLQQERLGTRRLRALARAGHTSADELLRAAQDLGGVVPDQIRLGRKPCHLVWNLGNCLSNFGKSRLEAAYEDAHRRSSQQAKETLGQVRDGATRSADEALLQMRTELYLALDQGARFLKATVARLEQLAGLVSVLLTVLLVIALVKSFMFVLATRLFDAVGAAHIGFDVPRRAQGSYESGSAITIDRAFTEPMVTRVTLDNQENSKVLAPWPWSAPLTRILRNSYFLFTRGSHYRHGDRPMHFSRANGQHIVKWTLEEGEEVVFHYRNFFGASANLQLKKTISLRLSTILLGRFVFHSAVCERGQGILLLTVGGTVTDHRQTDSTTLDRLVAWNRHTRFRVSSNGTVRAVLLDGYTIVRERDGTDPSGLIVVEAIGDQRKLFSGAAQFIKTLFLPF